jgi:hypothetical protein
MNWKGCEESSHDTIWGANPEFGWRNLRKTSVTIVSLQTDI